MRKMRLLGKDLVQGRVQRARGGEVAPERLLDDDPRAFARSRASARFSTTTGNRLGGMAR